MVCPVCIATTIAANAQVIATTGLALTGIVAAKINSKPDHDKRDCKNEPKKPNILINANKRKDHYRIDQDDLE